MPTILGHTAIPLALRLGLGRMVISPRLLIVGLLACILPDADVLAFRFGIPYEHLFGHRGFTHSIFFAFLCGITAFMLYRPLRSNRISAFVFVFICALSHVLLDAMTNGGLGVALYSPFSNERYFLPWRVIQVSPIGMERFIDGRAWHVLESELYYVWLPSVMVTLTLFGLQKYLNKKNAGN